MIVPFSRTADSQAPIQPTAQMPSQTQLLMAAAEMHKLGKLGGEPEADSQASPQPVLGPSSADETKPPKPRRRHR